MSKSRSGIARLFSRLSKEEPVKEVESREEFISSLQIRQEFNVTGLDDLLEKVSKIEDEMQECQEEAKRTRSFFKHFTEPMYLYNKYKESDSYGYTEEEAQVILDEFMSMSGVYTNDSLEAFFDMYIAVENRLKEIEDIKYKELADKRARLYKLKENIDKGFMFPDEGKGREGHERQ